MKADKIPVISLAKSSVDAFRLFNPNEWSGISKASVQSEWCQKELSDGLIRELEEKRVVVLPVLIEDCKIPLFLRDKLYADFRHDFD